VPVAGSDSFPAGYTAGEPIMRTMPEALDLRVGRAFLNLLPERSIAKLGTFGPVSKLSQAGRVPRTPGDA
jgi:hypothetical protein